MKRRISFLCVILAVAMLCGIPSAYAAGVKGTVKNNTYVTTAGAVFADYLEKEGYKFTYEGTRGTDEKQEDLFSLVFTCDNAGELEIYVWFDYDSKGATFFIWDYATVNAGQMTEFLTVCNQANRDFRYVTFYIEEDNTVTISADAIFRDNDIGEICEEMMLRVLHIADDCYMDFQ